jgi:hypothetical protein
MVRITIGKHLPVGSESRFLQIFELIPAQHPVIPAVFHLLGNHPLHLVVWQRSVAIVQTTACVPAE